MYCCKPIDPVRGVKKGGYEQLIYCLVKNGMVELQSSPVKTANGVFAIPKEKKQRLIIDSRNANCDFVISDDPHKSNRSNFA